MKEVANGGSRQYWRRGRAKGDAKQAKGAAGRTCRRCIMIVRSAALVRLRTRQERFANRTVSSQMLHALLICAACFRFGKLEICARNVSVQVF